VMELIKEPVAADPNELAHPLAIQLEKEIFYKLEGKGIDLPVVHQALELIKKYHAGVKRKSGEPFFTHPMQVALILMEYSKDPDTIVAGLLHDVVEDTSLSLSHIQAMFGKKVGFLVAQATNLENKLKRINLADHENLHRLMNYEDKGVALVKLADRLHNMRTISGHSSLMKQKRIAEETLTFFVPMAKNLNMAAMAGELEKLSLGVLGS
jgi:(p)ppGpp synthase/HD superfamily hydrolase